MKVLQYFKEKRTCLMLLVAVLFVAGLSSCEKDFEGVSLPLAVNSTALMLDTAAGSSHVMVYSTGTWSVGLEEPAEWLTLDRKEGDGNSDFVFSYEANWGAARTATIVISRDTMVRKISINQKAR